MLFNILVVADLELWEEPVEIWQRKCDLNTLLIDLPEMGLCDPVMENGLMVNFTAKCGHVYHF